MIDFRLSEERQAWVQMARDFAHRVVKPRVAELDHKQDPAACFPWDIVDAAEAIGLRNATLAQKYGGPGVDSLTAAMMVEELAAVDLGVSVIFAQNWKFTQSVQDWGTPEQCEKYLLPNIRDNPRGLMAACATEPSAGSDNLLPYNDPRHGLQTYAARDGDGWVLNGMKHFISLGNNFSLVIAFVKTDRSAGVRDGMTYFLVPRNTPGVRIGRVHDKLGERLSNNAEIFFENVRLADDQRLLGVNEGGKRIVEFMRNSNAYAAASVLGVGRAALEMAIQYARTRVQGGKPIIEHQAVAMMLAEMYTGLEAARLLTWRSAWASDRPEHFDPKMASVPKLYASEVAFQCARYNMEIHGGLGIMREYGEGGYGPEKLLRDAAVFLHSDGTNQMLKIRVGDILRRQFA